MAPLLPADEYNDIIRHCQPVAAPVGYTHVSAYSSPHILQICRDHTFARGRALHEIPEAVTRNLIGYILPAAVFELARRYTDGVNIDSWRTYSDHQQRLLHNAHWVVKKRFPRIPDIAAKEIPEKAWRQRWQGDKDELEDMVVQYALHGWTSHDFRFESDRLLVVPGRYVVGHEDPSKAAIAYDKRIGSRYIGIFKIVKPRLRQVLRSWLPTDFGMRELSLLYRKYDLQEDVEQSQKWRNCASPGMGGDLTVMSYGGAETMANITLQADFFT